MYLCVLAICIFSLSPGISTDLSMLVVDLHIVPTLVLPRITSCNKPTFRPKKIRLAPSIISSSSSFGSHSGSAAFFRLPTFSKYCSTARPRSFCFVCLPQNILMLLRSFHKKYSFERSGLLCCRSPKIAGLSHKSWPLFEAQVCISQGDTHLLEYPSRNLFFHALPETFNGRTPVNSPLPKIQCKRYLCPHHPGFVTSPLSTKAS